MSGEDDKDGTIVKSNRLFMATIGLLAVIVSACASQATSPPTSPPTTQAPPTASTTSLIDHGPGTGPWILYQGVFGGRVDLGLVKPDGSDAHRIPGATSERWHPDWSPDGTRIAYDHYTEATGVEAIAVLAVDGSADRVLVECHAPCFGMGGAAWTPDGEYVGFYYLADGGPCYLGLIEVDTGQETVVLQQDQCGVGDTFMRFSPDGQQIVFQREGPELPDGMALFAATIDGGNERKLTDAGFGARPDWSPDGEWIVFQSTEHMGEEEISLHRIRPDGTELERLTTPGEGIADVYPRYLPDGSSILFSRCLNLWVCETRQIDPDGSNDRLLFGELNRQTVHVMLQPLAP